MPLHVDEALENQGGPLFPSCKWAGAFLESKGEWLVDAQESASLKQLGQLRRVPLLRLHLISRSNSEELDYGNIYPIWRNFEKV